MHKVSCVSLPTFGLLVLKFWVVYEIAFKTAEKMLKMAIFKLLVLSYMHTTLYISFFYSNHMTKFYVGVKIQEKKTCGNYKTLLWATNESLYK